MSGKEERYSVNPHHFLDSITKEIVEVLLENPKIPYNRSTLAEAADVSGEALYRRWDSFKKVGLIEEADVESNVDHYQLNSDSAITQLLGAMLYSILDEDEEIDSTVEAELELVEKRMSDDEDFISLEEAKEQGESEGESSQ